MLSELRVWRVRLQSLCWSHFFFKKIPYRFIFFWSIWFILNCSSWVFYIQNTLILHVQAFFESMCLFFFSLKFFFPLYFFSHLTSQVGWLVSFLFYEGAARGQGQLAKPPRTLLHYMFDWLDQYHRFPFRVNNFREH